MMIEIGKAAMKFAFPVAILAAGALVFLAGCGGDEGAADKHSAEEAPADPVVRRMEDPKYVAQMKDHIEKRRQLMVEMSEAKKKLEAKQAAGATEEELKPLRDELERLKKDMLKRQKAAQADVAARVRRDAGLDK